MGGSGWEGWGGIGWEGVGRNRVGGEWGGRSG